MIKYKEILERQKFRTQKVKNIVRWMETPRASIYIGNKTDNLDTPYIFSPFFFLNVTHLCVGERPNVLARPRRFATLFYTSTQCVVPAPSIRRPRILLLCCFTQSYLLSFWRGRSVFLFRTLRSVQNNCAESSLIVSVRDCNELQPE